MPGAEDTDRGKVEEDKVEIHKVSHHRNGITGIGFWCVTFRYTYDRARQVREMLATVSFETEECDCRVIELADPHETWRGDRFQHDLLEVSPELREAKAEEDKNRAEWEASQCES
jgi:hypothetical protein